mmetsp:Transcript_31809/g.30328  ORF Transcript_31809/g.30328 Transcript_31809/m.30328 type:complete len:263 (-) Transcript_31809:73-861(-)|eukprot:CAMPEP_0119042228 /NCGR_PEP_ID=MMETSP1177-20130426/14468_1 /TAXON_ID=2985 /ORGANISM="Ochromonas sp, Strain CCMP1899" /LENGTH=262 /DNA_ID=CAMNT_0007008861 /DNA_START=75 /DNA_END=863 /DNA_ORIENTATION=+
MASFSSAPVVGIFAIQGAVSEHSDCVKKCGGIVKEIRMPQDFEGVDGIILPGGESTTMSIVGEKWGLFPKLKDWVAEKNPIWGTCAGMILLSDHAIKQAKGGQSLVGGLDVHVCRNFFGSQVHSCQVDISINASHNIPAFSTSACPAVFIRAPAILSIGPEVEVLASMVAKPHKAARDDVIKMMDSVGLVNSMSDSTIDAALPTAKRQRLSKVIVTESEDSFEVFVAVQQGNILATSFHPELTEDIRWHQYFMDMITASKNI